MGKKDEAYEYIKEQIFTNCLVADQAISELDISNKLQMSRTPVREALLQLENDGLVVTYPARGTIVASFTPYDVEEISELRTLLEVWALEKSINSIESKDLQAVKDLFIEGHEKNDWNLLHQADRQLHNLIVDRAGSKRLRTFMRLLYIQIEHIRRVSEKSANRSNQSYVEHMEIIDCIERRDLEKGKQALRDHLRSVGDSAVDAARRKM